LDLYILNLSCKTNKRTNLTSYAPGQKFF
jgi:hypothetical protein